MAPKQRFQASVLSIENNRETGSHKSRDRLTFLPLQCICGLQFSISALQSPQSAQMQQLRCFVVRLLFFPQLEFPYTEESHQRLICLSDIKKSVTV